MQEFRNEPLTDFTRPENREAFAAALGKVRSSLGKSYPLWIDGKEVTANETYASYNPSRKEEMVGEVSMGTTAHIDQAIAAGWKTFSSWSQVPAEKRADYLFRAATKMRERKHEFSAWMVVETGKSWVEADADTAEAIDFMDFYAREMLRLAEEQPLTRLPGEKNRLRYIPLGVGAVIPPWNFPNAIMVGMSTAAIVSGNCVVLKPASDAPVIANQFVLLMKELGLPAGVLNLVTGRGGSIGDHLVGHAKTRFISFTGSKEIGLRINEIAAKPQEGQIWIKRVIAEMGGKDAIIVDKDADREEAAKMVVASAFGYQGQKCSACSRAIIHQDVYDDLVIRIREKASQIKVGNPELADVPFGPVINQAALKKTLEYIEIGKKEGKLTLGGVRGDEIGYFVPPTIIEDVGPDARLSKEEIFGPVLALSKAKNFDEALEMVNGTDYGLTGAVFTKTEEHKKKAAAHFHVGNLYFNRKCTGALVGVHPFGGFNMSGTDSKAGGRDYLLLFTQAKLISEKTG